VRIGTAIEKFRGHEVPHMNLIARKKWWFALSGFFVILSVIGLAVRGLNFSIDFEGGSLLKYPCQPCASGAVTADEVRSTLSRFGHSEAEVQVVNGDTLNVRTAPLTEGGPKVDSMLEALAAQAGTTTAQISRQDVGPTWGAQISNKAIKGLIIFLVLVTVYIAFRFEWKMAVAAQTALLHDLVITAGIYALVGRTVTPATVIAILTILGYSLYDTVVIFDKVKENSESMALVARETYSGVVNMSLNQVFMRSVNTSLVVLLPILSLLLFGGETLKDFAFALFVGVTSGAYSSIFVASPVLAVLKEREPKNVQIRTRVLARAAARPAAERERVLQAVPGGAASSVTGDGGAEPAAVTTPGEGRRPSTQAAASSRPKKKKRKTTAAQRRRR
jgi:preprotein translocase subunit SecF